MHVNTKSYTQVSYNGYHCDGRHCSLSNTIRTMLSVRIFGDSLEIRWKHIGEFETGQEIRRRREPVRLAGKPVSLRRPDGIRKEQCSANINETHDFFPFSLLFIILNSLFLSLLTLVYKSSAAFIEFRSLRHRDPARKGFPFFGFKFGFEFSFEFSFEFNFQFAFKPASGPAYSKRSFCEE